MMLSVAILPHEWRSFAEQFSRQHRGWLVTLEVTDTRLLEIAALQAGTSHGTLAIDRAFQELVLDRSRGESRFRIIAGQGAERLVHEVRQPIGVQFERGEDGAHRGVRIDAADGTTTLVRFRAAAHPELLDGIGDAEW